MVLLEGAASEQQFYDANVQRPDVTALMRRISLVADAGLSHSEASATARRHDGEVIDVDVPHASGTPQNP